MQSRRRLTDFWHKLTDVDALLSDAFTAHILNLSAHKVENWALKKGQLISEMESVDTTAHHMIGTRPHCQISETQMVKL